MSSPTINLANPNQRYRCVGWDLDRYMCESAAYLRSQGWEVRSADEGRHLYAHHRDRGGMTMRALRNGVEVMTP